MNDRYKNSKENYFNLLDQQNFDVNEQDYSFFEQQKPNLQKLADIGHSVISVFDLYQKKHIFYSSNLGEILGYKLKKMEDKDEYFWDKKIHPDDYAILTQNAPVILKLLFSFSADEKLNHKLVNEYRILNASNHYVSVIEQQQVLALDNKNNLWLALSILDISPNQQQQNEGLKTELFNFRTGKAIPFTELNKSANNITLSKREIEVLQLVKHGLLSKEISAKLFISVHTVNTHRQKILEKLGVDNSMEAVILASKLGLL